MASRWAAGADRWPRARASRAQLKPKVSLSSRPRLLDRDNRQRQRSLQPRVQPVAERPAAAAREDTRAKAARLQAECVPAARIAPAWEDGQGAAARVVNSPAVEPSHL